MHDYNCLQYLFFSIESLLFISFFYINISYIIYVFRKDCMNFIIFCAYYYLLRIYYVLILNKYFFYLQKLSRRTSCIELILSFTKKNKVKEWSANLMKESKTYLSLWNILLLHEETVLYSEVRTLTFTVVLRDFTFFWKERESSLLSVSLHSMIQYIFFKFVYRENIYCWSENAECKKFFSTNFIHAHNTYIQWNEYNVCMVLVYILYMYVYL